MAGGSRPAPGGAHARGWVVGSVAGAPVVLSPGWLVAAVVLTVLLAPVARGVAPDAGFVGGYLLALAAVALLFGSTFLHEVAHALAARRQGITVRQVAITLLGGHTELDDVAGTPRGSALVAVAGPVVNLALAGLAALAWWLLPGPGAASALLLAAAVANGFVGAFNLLPGLPLDGGRVLEALVWQVTGRRPAGTRLAAWVGRVVAVGVVAWAVLPDLVRGDPPSLTRVVWAALIGAFVWSGAGQALRAADAEEAVGALSVAALAEPAVGLPVTDTLGDLDALGVPVPAVVLLADDGAPVGYVDLVAAAAVPGARRLATPLGAVGVPVPPEAVVPAALTGRAAVRAVALAAAHAPVMPVLGGEGEVVGLLRATDVVAALRPRGSGRRRPVAT